MVFDKKEWTKNYQKNMSEEEKEKKRERTRKWKAKNKEKIKEYNNTYLNENKDKVNEKNRNWRSNNKDKIREYKRTPKEIKGAIIRGWKKKGVICDYDIIYEIYVDTKECDYCKFVFPSTRYRHLDHNHESGEIRGIICSKCNRNDVLK